MIFACLELTTVVLFLIFNENPITMRLSFIKIPQIRYSFSIQLSIATSEVIIVQSSPVDASFLSEFIGVFYLSFIILS